MVSPCHDPSSCWATISSQNQQPSRQSLLAEGPLDFTSLVTLTKEYQVFCQAWCPGVRIVCLFPETMYLAISDGYEEKIQTIECFRLLSNSLKLLF